MGVKLLLVSMGRPTVRPNDIESVQPDLTMHTCTHIKKEEKQCLTVKNGIIKIKSTRFSTSENINRAPLAEVAQISASTFFFMM